MADVEVRVDQVQQSIGGENRIIKQRAWGTTTTPDGIRYDGTAQETEYEWVLQDTDPPVQATDPETGDPLWEDEEETIPLIEQEWVQTITRDEQVDWTAQADRANRDFENEQEGSAAKNRHSYFISEGDWYEAFSGTSNDTQRDQYNSKTADTIENLCKQVASLTKALNALGGGDESELG